MGIFKNKKTGEPSKFAEFVKDIGSKITDINPLEILTSPNPLGALLNGLTNSPDAASKQYLLELEQRKVEFEKDWELSVFSKEVEDKDSAREMYADDTHGSKDFADDLAKKIIKNNPLYIGGLVLLEICMIMYIKFNGWSVEVAASIGTTTGMIIQSLLNERKEIIGFYFGSSLGSKIKDGLNKAKNKVSEILN